MLLNIVCIHKVQVFLLAFIFAQLLGCLVHKESQLFAMTQEVVTVKHTIGTYVHM